MVSLTNFANFSKKATLFSILGLAAIILLLVIFIFGKSIKNSFFPPKPLPATVAFGKLPPTDLSDGIKPQGKINYKIETISGELPVLATNAKVFVVEAGSPSFGLLDEIKNKANKIGFLLSPQILNDGFKFVDPKNGSRILVVNNVSGSFSYQTDLQSVLKPRDSQEAIKTGRQFLALFGLKDDEFPDSRVAIINFKVDGNKFSEAKSFSETNLVGVNFYRADLDKSLVLPITNGQSLNSALVGDTVVQAKMNIYNLARYKFATYPLKGVQKAYQELQNGAGVFNKDLNSDTYSINDVYLAYVESSKTQNFLQPVYVFGGGNNLKAFINAVSDDWIIRN